MEFFKGKIYYLVAAVSVLLYSGFTTVKEPNIKCEEDITAVYSVIIDTVDQEMRYSTSKYKKVAILDSTEIFSFGRYPVTPDSGYFEKQFPDLSPSTFRSFLRNNEKKRSLPKELTKSRISCNQDDPEARCLLFSDVGFSTDCDQAMVSFIYICGGKTQCGYKEFVLLERGKDRWLIKDDFVTYEI